ncbi:MAG: hypothetical protein LBI99_08210 [Propionibacteriaceae bacterium]|nr:hypothetical protein [Propionibacteriaceae bacterium]
MGLTGLIFGAIAAAWLVYLVPYFLHRRGLPEDQIDEAYSTTAITIVRTGTDLAAADEGAAEVLSNRTRLAKLNQADQRAATRRRSVLIFLLAVQIAVAVLVVCGLGEWWTALIPFAVITAFLVVARVTVRRMRAELARQAREIKSCEVEDSLVVKLTDSDVASHEHSIELSVPVPKLYSLLDPIPITRPNYISQPLAPRTVRTIDLSAPVTTPGGIPVAIDDPLPKRGVTDGRRHQAG